MRKFISVLLVLCVCLSIGSVNVFAEDNVDYDSVVDISFGGDYVNRWAFVQPEEIYVFNKKLLDYYEFSGDDSITVTNIGDSDDCLVCIEMEPLEYFMEVLHGSFEAQFFEGEGTNEHFSQYVSIADKSYSFTSDGNVVELSSSISDITENIEQFKVLHKGESFEFKLPKFIKTDEDFDEDLMWLINVWVVPQNGADFHTTGRYTGCLAKYESGVDDIIAPGFPSDDEVKIPEKPEDMPKDDVSIPEKPGTIVAPGYPSDEEESIPKKPDVCIEIFEPFDDVTPSDYYYDAVMWAVENGITKGTSEFTFSPDDTCTVTEILTFLYRAEGSPSPSGSYSWISDGEYYTDALNWLTDLRVIYKDDVSIDCTRLAAVNYMHSLKLELGDPSALSFRQYNNITDVESWLRTPVDWALSRGITKGTSDTTFSPDDICTRGQIVTFLYRAYTNK